MSSHYTIELTESEVKAMEFVAFDVQEWAENALKNRARQAIDEIYDLEVKRMTDDPEITSIPADKDTVVLSANLPSASERQAESEAEMAAMTAEEA